MKLIKNPKAPKCGFGAWIKPWNENTVSNFKVRHKNRIFLGYVQSFIGYLIYWMKYLLILLSFGITDMHFYKISTAKCPFKKNKNHILHFTQLNWYFTLIKLKQHTPLSPKDRNPKSELQFLRNKIYKISRGETFCKEEGIKKCRVNSYNAVENSVL